MPSTGSLIRWFVGILLSAEIVRDWVFGGSISIYAIALAALFLGLSVVYVVFKF